MSDRWSGWQAASGYKIVLSDGSYIFEYMFNPDARGFYEFYIDVNGDKGPNGLGRDVYWFRLFDNDRRFDFAGINQDFDGLSRVCDKSSRILFMDYCGAYLKRNNWKMDY